MKKWFLSILFFLLSPVCVSAFSLAPSRIDLTINPGETQILEIIIKNNDVVARDFKTIVIGVEQTKDGAPRFVSGASDVESWASSKTNNLSLLANQEKKIQFLIDVPTGAYPGSYYLGLGVEQLSGKAANVNLSGRIVSLVNIKVAGIANEELKILNWESERDIWFSPSWNFLLNIKNEGNVELPLAADLVVRNFFGKELSRKSLVLGSKLIPDAARDFDFSFFLPDQHVFFPGIYQADLFLRYGLTNQQIVVPVKFWYIYPPLIFLFTLIIFSPVLFFLGKKIFFKNKR